MIEMISSKLLILHL